MALRVEVPASAINTEIEFPVSIGLGDHVTVVGTITLEVRNGQVEDFRPVYADVLRKAADAIERTDLDDEGDDSAAP